MVQRHPSIQSHPLRGAQLGRQDSQPPGQSGLLSQGVRSPATRNWSPRGESGDLTATARGQSWKSHSSHPGVRLGGSCGAGVPLASREPRPEPEKADWAPLRFPVRSNWHYLPCETSDAFRSIGGVTWRLSRGRPGDACVRGRRQLLRGAQAVTHRTAFTGV